MNFICSCWLLYFVSILLLFFSVFFFFNDTATTEIYTLSLHDALPISELTDSLIAQAESIRRQSEGLLESLEDRKSTRLNSSYGYISYAVFCLKKKKRRRADRAKASTHTARRRRRRAR